MSSSARPSHTRSRSIFSSKSQESNDSTAASKSKKQKSSPKDHRPSGIKHEQSFRNPNYSMTEPTPGERAQQEGITLSPLRAVQHKDYFGNVITDADASNPTRNRLERPLDTIRSFEAAIDDSYKRRSHTTRTGSGDATDPSSRRSSFVDGHNDSRGYERSYGGPRMSSSRQTGNYPMRPNPYRGGSAPMASQPVHEYDGYPSHGYHESYDTVNTGESSGSQSTEPWTNGTDPSSENSSMDRIQAHNMNKMEYDAHGQDRRMYAPQQNYQPQGYPQQYTPARPPQPPHGVGSMGPPPPAHAPQQRHPIRLGADAVDAGPRPAPPPSNRPKLQKNPSDNGKRKSWLKRRFSKG